jgi:cysteinyl-tRNA synthetase
MTLKLHNTLTRRKEAFKPADPSRVTMYVCGPTVYNHVHIGNARPVVAFDVLFRVLRRLYGEDAVVYARNITDVDDKINAKAAEEGVEIKVITDRFTAYYHERGFAYAAEGHVLFDTTAYPDYGALSGRNMDDMIAGARVEVAPYKKHPADFVLWKPSKPGEPVWDGIFGPGRPGWHIECSAMSKSLLGLPLDIHGGGPDLKFPHHENEIAQTEGAFGGTLANIWMHCGPLMVDSDKMSKSLGNFRTIRQTIAQGDPATDDANYSVNPREAEMVRFFIVRNHYRSSQNYTPDNLIDAQNALDRLYQALQNVPADDQGIDWNEPQAQAFKAAMDDDFNSSGAVAALFELASEANRGKSARSAGQLKALASLLGLLQQDPATYFQSPTRYSAAAIEQGQRATLDATAIQTLIDARAAAKAARDFAEADRIRAELREAGIELDDKPGGLTQWRRA